MGKQSNKAPPIEYEHFVNLLVIGDANTGKSSLVERYVENTFSDIPVTLSDEFKTKIIKIGDIRVKVKITDTVGAERYRVGKNHFRGKDGFLLVCDVTNMVSIENIGNWLKEVAIMAGPKIYEIIILLNKIDLEDERLIDDEIKKEIFKEFNIQIQEISVKNNIMVEESMNEIIKQIVESKEPIEPYSPPKKDKCKLM